MYLVLWLFAVLPGCCGQSRRGHETADSERGLRDLQGRAPGAFSRIWTGTRVRCLGVVWTGARVRCLGYLKAK